MYLYLYHTHKVAIIIFLTVYFVKAVLLLSNRKEILEKFTRVTKIPEMIVSVLFLVTGIWLLFETSEIRPLLVGKILVVIGAIPIAVIAYRKLNKPLAVLSMVMLVSAYGMAEMNKSLMAKRLDLPSDVITDASHPDYHLVDHGKALYETQCINCHGLKGNLRMSGAKDLTQSKMNREEIIERITNGKITMPPYGDQFTEHEIAAVTTFVLNFQK